MSSVSSGEINGSVSTFAKRSVDILIGLFGWKLDLGIVGTNGSGRYLVEILAPLKPARVYHSDGVGGLPADDFTVSKNLSWVTCNWGGIRPVVRLSTSETVRACLGECPKFIPNLALGSHFGMLDVPLCSVLCKVYTRHPKVWWLLGLGWTSTPVNFSRGVISEISFGVVIKSSFSLRSE